MARWKTYAKIVETLEDLDYLVESERAWLDEKNLLSMHIKMALHYAFYGLKETAKKESENAIMKIDTENRKHELH